MIFDGIEMMNESIFIDAMKSAFKLDFNTIGEKLVTDDDIKDIGKAYLDIYNLKMKTFHTVSKRTIASLKSKKLLLEDKLEQNTGEEMTVRYLSKYCDNTPYIRAPRNNGKANKQYIGLLKYSSEGLMEVNFFNKNVMKMCSVNNKFMGYWRVSLMNITDHTIKPLSYDKFKKLADGIYKTPKAIESHVVTDISQLNKAIRINEAYSDYNRLNDFFTVVKTCIKASSDKPKMNVRAIEKDDEYFGNPKGLSKKFLCALCRTLLNMMDSALYLYFRKLEMQYSLMVQNVENN